MSDCIRLDLQAFTLSAIGGKTADLAGNFDQVRGKAISLVRCLSLPIPATTDFRGFPVPPSVHRDLNGNLWLDWNESSAREPGDIASCLSDRVLQICLEWSHESPEKTVQVLVTPSIHPDWSQLIRSRLGDAFEVKIGFSF